MTQLPTGDLYQGEMKDGLLHGFGTLEYGNGDRYTGEFSGGKFHGRGTHRSLDKTYLGEFVDGRRHGKGRLECHLLSYDGEWRADKFHGRGTLTNRSDGTVYVGEFRDMQRHGDGIATMPDGRRIESAWIGGKAEGAGTISFPDGRRYQGGLKAGKLHGQGTMTHPDGKTVAGQWENDKMNGPGSATVDGRLLYKGRYLEGLPHGQGELHYQSGDSYQGEFLAGKRHGRGSLTGAWGCYEGHFVQDRREGPGILLESGGNSRREGYWIDGAFTGSVQVATEKSFLSGYELKGKRHGPCLRKEGGVTRTEFYDMGRPVYGSWTGEDGSRYWGELNEKGEMEGFGSYSNGKTGVTSLGQRRDGLRDGACLSVYSNGDAVECAHIKGVKSGYYRCTKRNGMVARGHFCGGDPIGEFSITKEGDSAFVYHGTAKEIEVDSSTGHLEVRVLPDGTGTITYHPTGTGGDPKLMSDPDRASEVILSPKRRYQGEFSLGEFHGAGTLLLASGAKFVGTFDESRPVNFGRLFYPEGGICYAGDFYGAFDGHGAFFSRDGSSFRGAWISGKRVSGGSLPIERDPLPRPEEGSSQWIARLGEIASESQDQMSVRTKESFDLTLDLTLAGVVEARDHQLVEKYIDLKRLRSPSLERFRSTWQSELLRDVEMELVRERLPELHRLLSERRSTKERAALAQGQDQKLECKICLLEIDSCWAVAPCGHAGFCRECLLPLRSCPICRATKEGMTRIYL
jgi:hypothetical protein